MALAPSADRTRVTSPADREQGIFAHCHEGSCPSAALPVTYPSLLVASAVTSVATYSQRHTMAEAKVLCYLLSLPKVRPSGGHPEQRCRHSRAHRLQTLERAQGSAGTPPDTLDAEAASGTARPKQASLSRLQSALCICQEACGCQPSGRCQGSCLADVQLCSPQRCVESGGLGWRRPGSVPSSPRSCSRTSEVQTG